MDSEQSSHAEQADLTDVQLWQATQQGQTEALGVLYDRHAGLVYGIALKVLGNSQEAEDLTQDIFIKLIDGSSYDPQRGSLRTFLAILTRSRALDRVRSRQRESLRRRKNQTLVFQDSIHSSSSSIDEIFQQEQKQEIRSALSQLSEQQQQLLRMSYYDGLTQSAIAERLNLPLGTVKSKVRRGLLKLRQVLQDRLD
ncbi:MAG: sigma-70 family RNA polymerase sigma factor [Thainema sp.]